MENKNIIKILRWPLVLIVLFITAGGLGSWFLFWRVEQTEGELEILKEDYAIKLADVRSYAELKENYQKNKLLGDEIKKMLVGQKNTLGLIEELEKAAVTAGIGLKTNIGIKPGSNKITSGLGQCGGGNMNKSADDKKEKDNEIWLQLNIEGRYASILQFIAYLENSYRLISIESVKFSQAQNIGAEDFFQNQEALSLGDLKAEILVTNSRGNP